MYYKKYHNKKTEVDGIVFDSKKEANRYCELKLMERAGLIDDLKLQQPFTLLPSQKRNGRVVERPIKYIADFVYKQANGELVVEDVKGMRTTEYKLKKKLMLYFYNIQIQEL